jgi:hypothetical protein
MHRARPGSADALVECASRLVCRCSEIEEPKYDEARTEKHHEDCPTRRHNYLKMLRVFVFVSMVLLFRTLLSPTYCSIR